jgi:hypothetical protein
MCKYNPQDSELDSSCPGSPTVTTFVAINT